MLINCVAYQDGKKLGDISVDDISDYVDRPECFVWVGLKEASPGELAAMQEEFGLHDLAVEDARKGRQRPKIEEYGDSLFVVLHVIELNADGELEIGEVDIFAGPNYVLSVRSHAMQGFQDVRSRCEREPHLLKYGSSFVLYALIDSVVDRYSPILAAIEAEIVKIEDRMFEKGASARQLIEELYNVKRKLMRLQQAVSPLLEATGKMVGGRIPRICSGMQDYYRDVYDHLLRIVKVVEGRREMITTAIQVNLAMISVSESETTKRLASYAALFAVPTMIAGIYGMNFDFMPELHWKYGYAIALLAMLVTDVLLWRRFRRVGWL